MTSNKKHIVIIGAGFAGINLAKGISQRHYDVTIIDSNNYHTFIPLLYQVATGSLEAENIAYPLRRIFRNAPHVRYRNGRVKRVHLDKQSISTTIGDIAYDYLVIATGSKVNFYNFEQQQDHLLTLNSVDDALRMRASLIKRLEQAVYSQDEEDLQALLTFVVVGGGPTGLEMAGVLAEMRDKVLPKDFPSLDLTQMRIVLVEQAGELLSNMSDTASATSYEYLSEMGVDIQLGMAMQAYDGEVLHLSDGTELRTRSVIWAAGVEGAPIAGIPEALVQRQNRLLIDEFCQLQGYDTVFAIGDVAAHTNGYESNGLPMLAPVAMQHGQYLAAALNRKARGRRVARFRYLNKGVIATIGRGKAVADLPFTSIVGFPAWAAWMGVHLFYLEGFRSKLSTLLNWAYNYINYDHPLGVIIWPKEKRL